MNIILIYIWNTIWIVYWFISQILYKYYIDLYIPELLLLIECDEFGHINYDKNKDVFGLKSFKHFYYDKVLKFFYTSLNFNL